MAAAGVLAIAAIAAMAPAAAAMGAAAGAPGPAAPGPPARVVTMAPNLTEIVFALGAGKRLVAVSDYSEHPPEARALPRLGGFLNPDVEQVLARRPDLVILRDYSAALEEKLAAFQVPVLRVRDEGIADILKAIRAVGKALGEERRGEALAGSIERELDAYRKRPEPARRPRVLLVAGRSPGTLQDLYAPGAGTFLDDLIRLAGGANLFGDSRIPYPKVSKEEVISRDPEVIIEPVTATSYAGSPPDPADWQALGGVSAVRHGRVRILAGDHLLIPGPRLVEALRDIERAIHAGVEGAAEPAPATRGGAGR
jgi:iron complex transport system substrate-binding protein